MEVRDKITISRAPQGQPLSNYKLVVRISNVMPRMKLMEDYAAANLRHRAAPPFESIYIELGYYIKFSGNM